MILLSGLVIRGIARGFLNYFWTMNLKSELNNIEARMWQSDIWSIVFHLVLSALYWLTVIFVSRSNVVKSKLAFVSTAFAGWLLFILMPILYVPCVFAMFAWYLYARCPSDANASPKFFSTSRFILLLMVCLAVGIVTLIVILPSFVAR